MTGHDMAVDDVYQKLRLSFPFVRVQREDVRDTPELARLLLTLSTHVDESGMSHSVSADLRAEQARLAEQLRSFHETQLLHGLLEDLAVTRPDTGSQLADDKLREAVAGGLSLAELHDCLPLSPPPSDGAAAEHTLLQLTTDQLTLSSEWRQTLARLPRALDQQLEALGQRCAAAVCPEMADDEDAASRLARLPSQIEEMLRRRADSTRRLDDLLERKDAQILRQSQLMAEQLEMMLRLITKHKLEHKVDLERKTIDHLTSNIQGMQLKIRQLALQIQCETYTERCLAALRAAARHLRAEAGRLDCRLGAAKHQLAAYESAGPQFTELARRYRQLCQEVDHRRWLISEVGALGSAAADTGGKEANHARDGGAVFGR